ncbi:signal peptide containing protein [Theileria equi strain WA]|uniref:Signal peptide containing protein n=1 Tax=Theileria equi strain WA TaxID=1537102 RepID=L1LF39_THEEQ|nr:signal peptide containing protein [Theileria equi strain WA]EKX73971.1 signal peptide containing protein [Theileria equi strain WA]|eukprot:XP_004833423.1 signal peptide containing protein [Theileria equi strain WA]
MNVSSVILATCLVGLCRCRNSRLPTDRLFIEVLDDYAEDEVLTSHIVDEVDAYKSSGPSGQRQVWDLSNGTVYEEDHAPSLTSRRNDRRVADVAVDESPVPQTSRHTTTLDISALDKGLFQPYDYDGVPTKMMVIGDVPLTKLVSGREKIWEREIGEKCIRSIVTMKDDKPVLVYLETEGSSGKPYSIFLRDGATWKPTNSYSMELKKLKITLESTTNFTIKLEDEKDTDKCTAFEAPFYTVPTRFYFPRSGFHATEVTHGGKSVWKGENGQRAFSVSLHPAENPTVLRILARGVNDVFASYYYQLNGNKWESVQRDDFRRIIDDLKSRSQDDT